MAESSPRGGGRDGGEEREATSRVREFVCLVLRIIQLIMY